MKRQQTLQQEDDATESINTATENSEEELVENVALRDNACAAAAQPQPSLITSEAELKHVIENLNPVPLPSKAEAKEEEVEAAEVRSEPKLRPVVPVSKHSAERRNTLASLPTLREVSRKDAIILDKFDFIGEFEKRCGRRKFAQGQKMDLPVIGKPHKADTIQSYRRKGLFDDVDYRRPPNLPCCNSQEDEGLRRAHNIYTCQEEENLADAMNKEEDLQNNNNSFDSYLTEKIIRAVLAEKPVSPISPNRRMSMIS
ncbi:unnamed protein product [Cylicostephanus goldi]|uniref:Uncharacterized protein n=1 Tax=Cylicostephanus goldi TaxID=71465 RepID=A0A3P6R1E2_CYLGO|nr:unnamed protein product [Cylicostephanus goldi]